MWICAEDFITMFFEFKYWALENTKTKVILFRIYRKRFKIQRLAYKGRKKKHFFGLFIN
jgi:hypothetical protein